MTQTLPATQKAMVFDAVGGPVEYRDIPVPKPGPGQILLHVQYSGVCHSDLSIWNGDWQKDLPFSPKLPLVGGHEGAGDVVALGEGVTNWKIGDLAGVKWINSSCLACEPCRMGEDSYCQTPTMSGFFVDGSYQQYALLDAACAARIPAGVDLAGVAPILCAGLTVYRAVKTANVKQGGWMTVTGAGGGLGTYAIQYAKAMGYRVIAIDTGDDKGALCLELGAEHFVDFMKDNVVDKVNELTGGGSQGVINCAVSDRAVEEATKYVRTFGTIVLVALPPNGYVKSHIFTHVFKSFNIKGTYVGGRQDAQEAIDFYARGMVKSHYKLGELSKLNDYYQAMTDGKILGRIVVDNSK
ncbi:Alcohol dehydrogenase 2 [Yarrowia sp. B02]|nr:Alcohol dehydrogenase 2 [Yarrowia sp. B02]